MSSRGLKIWTGGRVSNYVIGELGHKCEVFSPIGRYDFNKIKEATLTFDFKQT